jgi:hypothetical protein
MLLTERSKYGDIQEKMKKKKLENGLLAREIERLEEKLLTKKAQITNNNALLQYWQKEVKNSFSIYQRLFLSVGNGYCTKHQTTRRFNSSIGCF